MTMTMADRGDIFAPSNTSVDAAAEAAAAAQQAAADKAAAEKAEADAASAAKTSEESGEKDAEGQQAAPRDDKGRFVGIPKARFDEAVQKEREAREAAERQLAELQKQMAQVSRSTDVAKLEDQLQELRKAERRAIMDGNEEKSVELSSQIDKLNRQIAISEAQGMSSQAREEATETIRFDMAVERLEGIYPILKEGTEEYDQSLVDLVLARQQQLIQRDRMSPSQAITKAATDIMTRFQPPAKIDDKPAGGLGAKAAEQRTAQAKGKAVDAALRTPPSTEDVGLDTDKAGMKNGLPMPETIADLSAIPESTLKRMRGDML